MIHPIYAMQEPRDQEERSLLQRLRQSVLGSPADARHVTQPPPAEEVNLRKAISQLARARVSAMLRQLRSAHGYTYAQVQEQTGLPQQLLYDVEYRERRLTLPELNALAECYDVSASDVLGIDLDQ